LAEVLTASDGEGAMELKDYEMLDRLSDRELFDFVTEIDSSQRKWVAMHLLEGRRNRAITSAAKSSAIAAWVAAVVAGISAVVAVLAYFKT
jgi:hypothetical protein